MGIAMKNINRLIKVGADFKELAEDAIEWPVVKVERPGLPPLYFVSGEQKPMTLAKFEAYASKLRLCGLDGWRPPEQPELETIRELDRHDPACNQAFFPKCKSGAYWTRTAVPWSPDCARFVGFSHGGSDWTDRNYGLFVRAVCVGQ
jgi:hypothetical protein